MTNVTDNSSANLKQKLKEVIERCTELEQMVDLSRTKISRLRRERNLLLQHLSELESHRYDGLSEASASGSDTEDKVKEKPRTPPPPVQPGLRDGFLYEEVDNVMVRRLPNGKRLARAPPMRDGNLLLPFGFGQIVVYDVGKVVPERSTFYSQVSLIPLGYKMARPYLSCKDPKKSVFYFGSIELGADGRPLFVFRGADALELQDALIGRTSFEAWALVTQKAAAIRNSAPPNLANQPDPFGLDQAVIINLIQQLPGAQACVGYVPESFDSEPQPAVVRERLDPKDPFAPYHITPGKGGLPAWPSMPTN